MLLFRARALSTVALALACLCTGLVGITHAQVQPVAAPGSQGSSRSQSSQQVQPVAAPANQGSSRSQSSQQAQPMGPTGVSTPSPKATVPTTVPSGGLTPNNDIGQDRIRQRIATSVRLKPIIQRLTKLLAASYDSATFVCKATCTDLNGFVKKTFEAELKRTCAQEFRGRPVAKAGCIFAWLKGIEDAMYDQICRRCEVLNSIGDLVSPTPVPAPASTPHIIALN
jgi:hypothetical protein